MLKTKMINKRKIILALCATAFSILSFGQQIMYTPPEYVLPMDSDSEALDNQEGEEFWMVFSDRANNNWFSDPGCNSRKSSNVSFMKPFLVKNESANRNAVHVVEAKYVDEFGRLKSGWESHSGWMKKTHLLLSQRCLKTRDANLPGFENGIFNKKALVLNVIQEGDTDYSPPTYYANPGCSTIIDTALVYQINFVFKETNNAYLLAEDELINPEDINKMRGWVRKNRTTPWNHNLAFEANWERNSYRERNALGIYTRIFEQSQDVNRYYEQKQQTGFGHIPYQEPESYYRSRTYGEVDRFPALKHNSDSQIWEVGVVGHLIGPNGERIPKEVFDRVKHVIDSISINLRKINIVFVIDATSSILPYRDYVINALTNTLKDLNKKEEKTFKFGAALYRDAAEGKYAFQAMPELVASKNINDLVLWVNKNMIADYNRCDRDLPEAVNYGIKMAVNNFALQAGQSNFVILIGDCGNHDRSTYNTCTESNLEEFTTVNQGELASVLAGNDVNLLSFQVHHHADQSYKDFVNQLKGVIIETAKKKYSDTIVSSDLWEITPSYMMLDTMAGGAFRIKCPSNPNYKGSGNPLEGSLSTSTFQDEISECLKFIDYTVDAQIKAIIILLKKNAPNFKNLSGVANIISKLNELGFSEQQIELIFNKNGQLYWTGYTKQHIEGITYPVFLDVLLTNHNKLYSIKYALEQLIPTNDYCMSPDDFRTFLQDTWESILVEQLKYFPPDNNMIDTLTLYELSAILTGWGGKEQYRDITLADVVEPDLFPDDQLYEYLIDWLITKGHIQSVYEGHNMFTKDFFGNHVGCYFIEYLIAKTGNEDDILDNFEQIENDLVNRLFNGFDPFRENYKNVPSFRIPIGESERAAETYYWNDSRIFPHQETINPEIVFYENLLKEYGDLYEINGE